MLGRYPYIYTIKKLQQEVVHLRRAIGRSVPTEGQQILLQLEQNDWHCLPLPEIDREAIYHDVRRLKVHGHEFHPEPMEVPSSADFPEKPEIKRFLGQLRLPDENDGDFAALLQYLEGCWRQELIALPEKIFSAKIIAASDYLLKFSYNINIYRDPQTRNVYLETELYGLALKDRQSRLPDMPIPGTIRYRFQLTPAAIQAKKDFRLDSIETSNSLLRDLGFDPKFDITQLAQRIAKIKQEESRAEQQRQLAHALAESQAETTGIVSGLLAQYTPESIERLMGARSWNSGLAELKEAGWYCKMSGGQSTLYGDVGRQTQVGGEVFHPPARESEAAIEQCLRLRLRLPREEATAAERETPEEFERYFAAVKKYYNQSLGGAFKVFVTAPLLALDFVLVAEATTNIYRDPETGDTYVETVLCNLKYQHTTQTKKVLAIPGTLRYRFKLTAEDIREDKGFHLDYVAPSNSLLRDLCFEEERSFTLDRLTSGLKVAEQEEREAARRRFYHGLAELESTVADENVDVTLRQRGKAVLDGLSQFKGDKEADYHTLAEVAQATHQMVRNPLRSDYRRYLALSERVPTKRSKGKILAGAMLVLLGAVLIVAAVMLAVATFGIATPLSALVIAGGVTVAVAGAAVAGAAGVAAASAGGVLLFKGNKSQPKPAMGGLVEAARGMSLP